MDDFRIIVGDLHAMLFCCALFSAAMFIQEIGTAWSIVCPLWHGRLRSKQIIGLASLGWFVGAIGSMFLTFHWIWGAIFYGRSPAGHVFGWEAVWSATGLYLLSLGFYLPVLASLWYRQRPVLGIALGLTACMVGIIFGILSARLPMHIPHM